MFEYMSRKESVTKHFKHLHFTLPLQKNVQVFSFYVYFLYYQLKQELKHNHYLEIEVTLWNKCYLNMGTALETYN